ncbi:hypothetical protein OROGR_001079 [Orobanche gracilis]
MKLFSNSSSLKSRAYYFHQNIKTQFFSTTQSTPTRTRFSKYKSASVSVYSRIAPLGDPSLSMMPVLDQWTGEGRSAFRWELQKIIKRLTMRKRFKHALEVSLWMTNKRGYGIDPFDVAVRLKLIFKIFGLQRVENYFDKIPENLKTYHVYLVLLNCYTMAKSLDKAEYVMQKARSLGYTSKAIWYNLMMNLHYQLGNREKLSDLLTEMGEKGISPDQFTLSNCLNACTMDSDALGMDRIVGIMESGPQDTVHCWKTSVIAAEGYLRMGLIDKALVIMKKLEGKLTANKNDDFMFVFLFKLYAEAGKKEELHRIWQLCKKKSNFATNKVYISMMRSLGKFGELEEMEKILEEWYSSGLSIDFRVPNFLIDAYCSDGRLEMAEALVNKGIAKGGNPLVLTWCHLAGGYLKKNQVPKAVEALKKAISVCSPKLATKDSLMNCLEYLEKGGRIEDAEELMKFVRIKGILREAASDDTDNRNSYGIDVSGDQCIHDKGNTS